MKKLIAILPLITISTVAQAQIFHCPEFLQAKPFYEVVIFGDQKTGFGPVRCAYKNSNEDMVTSYNFNIGKEYYPVSGTWIKTGGLARCATKNGGQFDSCLFSDEKLNIIDNQR